MFKSDKVEQSNNKVEGDIAGGDIDKSTRNTNLIFTNDSNKQQRLKNLFERFQYEKENDIIFMQTLEELEKYGKMRDEPVQGLGAKMISGNRTFLLDYAEEVKEKYTKKLIKFQFYESAQKINAQLLAFTRSKFMHSVYPSICRGEDAKVIDNLLSESVLKPLSDLLDGDTLEFDYEELDGIVYYLTGNCYIKWSN